MNNLIQTKIENLLGEKIEQYKPLSGGCINQNYLLTTKNNNYFLKLNPDSPSDFFEKEAKGLDLLATTKTIRIPKVFSYSSDSDQQNFLLLEYLRPGKSDYVLLAKQLANLHQTTSNKFGLDYDNYIGSTQQSNCQHTDWAEFFYQERLLYQVELGVHKQWLSQSHLEKFLHYKNQLISCLQTDAPPSLLHGDLWSGNIYWSAEGPALIDPAVYFGCFEADLAMTEMFGRLPSEFYQTYFQVSDLSGDYRSYKKRTEIYNFYHLLNHGNLFSGGYCRQAINYLSMLASQ